MDHRRAGAADQASAHHAILYRPVMLDLGTGPVRVDLPVADVHVRGPALAAAGVIAQVQVRKVQAAQLANPEAAVSKPCDRKAISRLPQRRDKPGPGTFRGHLRMAAADSAWCQRVRWHVGDDVSQEMAAPISLGGKPPGVE